jgi:transposase-like protein
MDPRSQFCPNPACPARGQLERGNVAVHSRKARRYVCRACGRTFAETRGTPFYRLHKAAELMTTVLTLLSHGCPVRAVVAAFGLDERTVAAWQARGGSHCRAVHEHLVLAGRVDLGHVQPDELWVKRAGGKLWQAMALAVPSRLWLGGALSPTRDLALIIGLVRQVRASAGSPAILVCVDGLRSYVTAFRRVFRRAERTGRRGRPRLVPEDGLLLGQVVKCYVKRHVASVEQRAVQGTAEAIAAVLAATGTGATINTAYIERLNATFRARAAALTRRGRAIARTEATLTAGMYLVGAAYNFCSEHASLRQAAPPGGPRAGRGRTPAMAAGLTDHRWTMDELLRYRVPPPAWVPPKRRGRPPKQTTPQPLATAA